MTPYSAFISVILVFCVLLFCIVNAVKVSIYYEALCPDSVRFITRQLYPHGENFKSHIELEFVPYGKAMQTNSSGTWKFLCQHGPQECNGNKYQACALSQGNKTQNEHLNFLNCVMRKPNPVHLSTIKVCSETFGYSFTEIQTCFDSPAGDNLLAEKGERTLNVDPHISFVPTIIFDDKFNEVAQKQALIDFAAVVCSKIVNVTKPALCESKKLPRIRSYDFPWY